MQESVLEYYFKKNFSTHAICSTKNMDYVLTLVYAWFGKNLECSFS